MDDFLDRIWEGIDRGLLSIDVKLKTSHLQTQIRSLQKQREEELKRLGNLVYNMLRQGTLDQERLKPYEQSLQALEAQIAELEEQVRRMVAEATSAARARAAPAFAYCNSCGAPLQETSRFCPRCGRDVTAIVAQAKAQRAASGATCPFCGAAIRAEARFCPSCGKPLEKPSEAPR